jgi:hypothetical protein
MAIIKSIVLENTTGRVGNVVFYRLAGQQIAREYNPSPYDPKTPGQIAQRFKVANAVKCYQVASVFLVGAKMLCKSTESIYNMFLRSIIQYMPTIETSSRREAWNAIYEQYIGFTSWLQVYDILHVSHSISVYFDTVGLSYESNCTLKIMSFMASAENNVIINHIVTEAEWLAGRVLNISLGAFDYAPAIYIHSENKLKCSNIVFHN